MNWQKYAACIDSDPDLFFPERGATVAQINTAKRICASCPVRNACREHGIKHEHWGIWGGLSERDRRKERRRRARAQGLKGAA